MKTSRKTVRLSTLRLSRNHPASLKLYKSLTAAVEACRELAPLRQRHGGGCGCERCLLASDAAGMRWTLESFAAAVEGLLLPEAPEVPGLALAALSRHGRPVA